DLVNEGGHRERIRFTTAVANGRDLYAFRFAENDQANSLYFRETNGEGIIVSEPFDKAPDWIEVPPDHVLVALASEPAKIVPVLGADSDVTTAEPSRLRRLT